MGNPPRHIAPGGHALRRHQIGHIVKGDHIAFQPPICTPPRRQPNQKAFLPPSPEQAQLFLRRLAARFPHRPEKVSKFRNTIRQRRGVRRRADIQQLFCRPVYELHLPVSVHPNHARGNR